MELSEGEYTHGLSVSNSLQLGATQAAGVDIDPLSISASRQNAERNGLSPQTLRVYLADRDSDDDPLPSDFSFDENAGTSDSQAPSPSGGTGSFDIVVANILINPLVALASRIASYAKPGAGIALSGVLEEQVDEVVRTYAEFMDHIEVTTEGGWACVSGRKR